MLYNHQVLVKIKDIDGFKAHFKKYDYALCKYRGEVILVLHGERDGNLPMLPRVRELGLKFDRVVCCFPRAVKVKYPELNTLGTEDMPSGYHYTAEGIELVIA